MNIKHYYLLLLIFAFYPCVQDKLPNSEADLSTLAPEFILTSGASINHASRTVREFKYRETYVVTSEDGIWKDQYTVAFQKQLQNLALPEKTSNTYL